jgi:hypothetical protein
VERIVELPRLLLLERVRPAVRELAERERDRAAAGARADQERAPAAPRPAGAERRGRPRGRSPPWPSTVPGPRASAPVSPGRVPDDRWFAVQGIDDLGRVIGDLLQGLAGEDVRVGPGLFNGFRVIGPVRRQRRVTGLREDVPSAGPAARQQPEAVDEDDRGVARGVGRRSWRRRRRSVRRAGTRPCPSGEHMRHPGARVVAGIACHCGGPGDCHRVAEEVTPASPRLLLNVFLLPARVWVAGTRR